VNGASLLERNIFVYEALVTAFGDVVRGGSSAGVLRLAEKIAGVAAECHVGRFDDGRLENPVHEIGASLTMRTHARRAPRPSGRGRRVLHVFSAVQEMGGHIRTVTRWMAADPSSVHSLVVINDTTVLRPFAALILQQGGTVASLHGTVVEKALQLRALARASADLVVLTIGNNDFVPCLAFADDDLPPIALINHSDHRYWVGNSVADAIINQRSTSALSGSRRAERQQLLLPIPLAPPAGQRDRAAARSSLGIPPSQMVLASIGRTRKYRPDGTCDFFRTAATLLDRHPAAHLYIAGPTAAEAAKHSAFGTHPRLHAMGHLDDPADLCLAADVYLESFPFGSQTACLEACMYGLPPVLALAPACPLVAASDDAIDGLFFNAVSEEEYLERAGELIERESRRRELGEEARRRVLEQHTGDGWLRHLDACYLHLDGMRHQHGAIRTRLTSRDPLDHALSAWNESQRVSCLTDDPQQLARECFNDFAYIVRQAGCYRDAILFLQAARPFSRAYVETTTAIAKAATLWALSGLASRTRYANQ
jgi:hypothetical protein